MTSSGLHLVTSSGLRIRHNGTLLEVSLTTTDNCRLAGSAGPFLCAYYLLQGAEHAPLYTPPEYSTDRHDAFATPGCEGWCDAVERDYYAGLTATDWEDLRHTPLEVVLVPKT